jgi:hypothetical protein
VTGTFNEVRREFEGFVAVARGVGRSKDLLLFRAERPDTPIAVDAGNPSAAAVRERLVNKIPEAGLDRVHCGILLRQLADAASVATGAQAAHRRNGSQADLAQPEEPWSEAVDGAQLLDELRELLSVYMVLPEHADVAIALWIFHTYVFELGDYTPYLLVTSPVRECGKSTLLELAYRLVYRGQLTGGITAGALYRKIDRTQPTILLDELDTRLKGDGGEALRGVLNTGFSRSGKVTICVGDAHEDKDFRTFCPKALAGIGRPWDTVTSRSIPIRLTRAPAQKLRQLRKIRGHRIDADCEPYRRRLLRWAQDVQEELREAEPDVPEGLGARQADVWRPLFAIADAAGGEWPQRARSASLEIYGVVGDESDSALLLLEDARDVFTARGNPTALFSATIVEELLKLEHRPWPEYRNGQPFTPTAMAKLFGRFEIRPKQVREGTHSDDKQKRGYRLEDLTSAFNSYLPPYLPEKTSHPSHSEADLTDRGSNVTDVTANTGGMGGSEEEEYERLERDAIQAEL